MEHILKHGLDTVTGMYTASEINLMRLPLPEYNGQKALSYKAR
jgi:hypothetical protein